jgi:diguanylate cyclase (GGDEF)-like protein
VVIRTTLKDYAAPSELLCVTTEELRRSLWAILTRPLPEGGSLPEDAWRRRHTTMLALLAVHAAALATIAAVIGADQTTAALAGGAPALFALAAAVPWFSRKLQAGLVAVGLVACSALLVHLSGGLAESYFHVFVVLALVALYQDWLPILIALGAITLHNFALDTGLHFTGFAVAASAVGIVAWRLNERERTLARQVLASTADGLYGRDLNGRITFVNDALTALIGVEAAELVGRSDHDVLGHAAQDGTHYSPGGCPACSAIKVTTGAPAVGTLAREDACPITVEYASTPIRERGQTVGAVVTIRDRTEHTLLTRKALHDQLTGLPNRALLDEHLRQALTRLERRPDRMVAVFFLDLDRFKVINDSLGHAAGDLLLTEVARRLQEVMRTQDTVARFGGDEFVVLCEDFVDERDVVRISERLVRALTTPITIGETELTVTTSIGVAMTADAQASPDSLVRDADAAMYRAKELGRNRYELFDDALRVRAVERLRVESELRRALTAGELVVHYQPKVNLGDGRLVGVEALVRWEHPRLGLLPPSEFLPLVDRTGLIRVLTRQVLREALEQCARWHEQGLHWHVSVNLSASSLMDAQLPREVWQLLESAGVEPRWLMLEMTEDQLMSDPARGQEVIGRLREMGLRVSIDDYGSGYSSMAHLRALTIDELKLDKAFVMELGTDRSLDAIVLSAVHLAHALDLELVAEGVESEIAWDRLRELGCDLAQGYYLSPPIPARQFPQWLSDWTRTWSARNPGAAPGQLPAAGAAPTMLRASS